MEFRKGSTRHGKDKQGVVSLKQYLVSEGDIVAIGESVALACTMEGGTWFKIVSNYDGRILKLILREGDLVAFKDPIATMELLSDPVNGRPIARCEIETR